MSVDNRKSASRIVGKLSVRDYQQVFSFYAEVRGAVEFISAYNDGILMPSIRPVVPEWLAFTDDEKAMKLLELTLPLIRTFLEIMKELDDRFNICHTVEERTNTKSVLLYRAIVVDCDTGWQRESSQLDYINAYRWILRTSTRRVKAKLGIVSA